MLSHKGLQLASLFDLDLESGLNRIKTVSNVYKEVAVLYLIIDELSL